MEFMIFGTNNRLNQLDISPMTTPYTLCFHNFEIKRVKHTKYLELIVDDTLTWDRHIEYISKQLIVILAFQKEHRTIFQDHPSSHCIRP